MKKIHASNPLWFALIFLSGILLLFSCTNSKKLTDTVNMDPTAQSEIRPNYPKGWDQAPIQLSLEDMFRRVPGLEIVGNGSYLTVRVRGPRSENTSNGPLFVVDGIPIGQSYYNLVQIIDPSEVLDIRVLKPGDASIYGSNALEGAVEIRLVH